MWTRMIFGALMVALIVLAYNVVVLSKPLMESATLIRRTVGTRNDADEVSMPGVIVSMPIMDMTHTYWDGVKKASCDDCLTPALCPSCPQYASAGTPTPKKEGLCGGLTTGAIDGSASYGFGVLGGYLQRVEDQRMMTDDVNVYNPDVACDDYSPKLKYGMKHGPFHDFDPEFLNSRERMGACSGGPRASHKYVEDIANLGTHNDDVFDGDRAVISSQGNKCPRGPSAVKLLYQDVMGLPNPPPTTEDCEYLTYNDYVYKQPCNIWSPSNSTLADYH